MIDAHCHIDLYNNPVEVAWECEKAGMYVLGMTNLPSHFEMGYPHLLSFKKVRLALGMHPLHAESHKKELPRFTRNLSKTSYVGEIGLDFSREGYSTKEIQLETFEKILRTLSGMKKIISLHSRRAEKEVLRLLIEHNIPLAIFHWYSGPVGLVDEIIHAGYYFSVNPAMIRSANGQSIIGKIPLERILTESDGPFIDIDNRPIRPKDVKGVLHYISEVRNIPVTEVEQKIEGNFMTLVQKMK